MPAGAVEQVEFLTQIASAGLVGVAVAEGMHAPPLEAEALAAADALRLPVLLTRYEIPFVALARAVAGANQEEERERLTRTQRLYEQMRLLTADTQLSPLLAALSRGGRRLPRGGRSPVEPRDRRQSRHHRERGGARGAALDRPVVPAGRDPVARR